MKDRDFTCARCGGDFTITDPDWTEEARDEEAKELWGVDNAKDDPGMEQVCDNCFNKVMASMN